MYLFYRLLKFVYSSFLKARKFLLAVTGAILAYSRDSRRWGLIRRTHHSNDPPFSPISKFLSVNLSTENTECSYTASFLCPPFVELELFLLDYPSTMVFPHAWMLFSRTTVMFSLYISSAIILSIQLGFLHLSMSHWYILLSNLRICCSIPCFWPCRFNHHKTPVKFLGSLMTGDTKEGKNKQSERSGCFTCPRWPLL